MVNVNDLRPGMAFVQDGQILQVLTYDHIKMGRGSGNVKVKVRNLKTGSIVEKSFITGARVEEIELDKRELQYLYRDASSYYFMDPDNFDQISIGEGLLGDQGVYLKEGIIIQVLFGEDQPLSVILPISIEYQVAETGPGERGNSVTNIYKPATLENGLAVSVPLFIKNGDIVKIDTRSGKYMERVTR